MHNLDKCIFTRSTPSKKNSSIFCSKGGHSKIKETVQYNDKNRAFVSMGGFNNIMWHKNQLPNGPLE